MNVDKVHRRKQRRILNTSRDFKKATERIDFVGYYPFGPP